MDFEKFHRRKKKRLPAKQKRKTGIVVCVIVVDQPPDEACLVCSRKAYARKDAIRRYKERFGAWPDRMYFYRDREWWMPVPDEVERLRFPRRSRFSQEGGYAN